jgi:hypothetical protein
MTKAAVLFNGLKFPFSVIDHSFEWAKKEKSLLLAVFLLSKDVEPEGYIFPSDIDAAENISDVADSSLDSEKVVESNIHMLKNRAAADQINFQSVVLHDPTEEVLSEILQDFDYIFVAKGVKDGSEETVESLDLKKWFNHFAGTVTVV